MKTIIKLSKMEIQSNHDRVKQAELLINQLPEDHEGRNSWLMNYGIAGPANRIRMFDNVKRKKNNYSPRELVWNFETECLNSVG